MKKNSGSDTLRVWEEYQDATLLWRTIALAQAPVSILVLLLCFYLWSTRRTEIVVPAKPAPGIYAVGDIPDIAFIDTATEFINLVATYQPTIARRQFLEAKKFLAEPMLSHFSTEMMQTELSAIETTTRTQVFYVDPTKTIVRQEGQSMLVTFQGDRLKIIAGRELPMVTSEYTVTLTVLPHNKLNPYGIVITGTTFKDIVQ
jgi:hypothetical protein